jgi:hypothetical protein
MTKEYYQAHKAEIQAKKRAYEQSEEGRAKRRAIWAKYDKSPKGEAKRKRYFSSEKGKATMKRHDDKRRATEYGIAQNKAHKAVRYALKTDRLKKLPCVICGDDNSYAHHHKGYAIENRLEVIWLCQKHHREAHAAAGIMGKCTSAIDASGDCTCTAP